MTNDLAHLCDERSPSATKARPLVVVRGALRIGFVAAKRSLEKARFWPQGK
jgi:hypothetical protein